MKRHVFGMVLCVLALAACAGTETGNPSFDGTLSYNAYTSNPQAVALLDGETSAIVVDNAWLVLGDVGFSTACASGAPADGHADGLGIGDHAPVAAAETPLTLAEGEYCGVHVTFETAESVGDGVPIELVDHSVYLVGTLADGRPFQLASALQGDVFLSAVDEPFVLDAAEPNVLIGFDVATWLASLPWSSAAANVNGVVVVDATRNPEVLDAFELSVGRGTALFRDTDNGQVTTSSEKLADGAP